MSVSFFPVGGLSVVGSRVPMRHRTITTAGPVAEPVTLAEAKLHLKVDVTDDDALITEQISSAREWVEDMTSLYLMTQTVTVRFDEFSWDNGGVMLLPRGPFQSFTSITYLDTAGASQTLTPVTDYRVDLNSIPGRTMPAYSKWWPMTYPVTNAVTFTYVAGYGSSAVVPARCKSAIKALVGSLYTFRENVMTDRAMNEVGQVCMNLIAPLRRRCINP